MKLFNTGAVEDVKIGFFVLQAVLNIEFFSASCNHFFVTAEVDDQVAADSCFSNKFHLIVHGTTTR